MAIPEEIMKQITKAFKSIKKPVKYAAYNALTEATLLNRAGIPTIICGPGMIDKAHKIPAYDETIKISDIEKYSLLLEKIFE